MAENNQIVPPDYGAIYGKWNELTPEEKAVQQGINDMLQQQYKQAATNRTDARRMAQFNAFGDVLRTAFNPIGWAIGGGTSQTIAPDNRAYISAFNNAIKADNDFRNLGNQQAQFKLNYDMQQAEKARAWRAQQAAAEAKQAQWDYETAVNQANMMERIHARGAWRESVEKLKADLRSKYQAAAKDRREQSIDSKLFMGAVKDAQAAYKTIKWRQESGMLPEGFELPSFRDFFTGMFPEWTAQYDTYIKSDRTVNGGNRGHAEL